MAKKAANPVPPNMRTITPLLTFNGNAREAMSFYQKAFGAELVGEIVPSPDGKTVWHSMLRLGDSNIMANDAMPGGYERGPVDFATSSLWIYVADCDALFNRAKKAGCTVIMEMMDAFWGDRMGQLKDPFGHTWAIAAAKWEYTPEEIDRNMKAWLATMGPKGK